MSWAIFAMLNAALSGIVSIFDSHLLSRRMPNLKTYLLPLGIFHTTVALAVLLIKPFPPGAQALPLIAAFGSGVLSGVGSVIMLNVIRGGEISRIIPVVNTSPIFVALMAVPLLGEILALRDWLGILLTVAGAVLISVQRDGGGKKARLQKSFIVLILCSLIFAASSIVVKYALGTLTFWNLYSANSIMVGLIFVAFAARRTTFRELGQLPRRNTILAITVLGQAIIVVAIIFGTLSIQEGPVALAITVSSSRPAFVFLFALAVSRFFPEVISEKVSRDIALLKLTAIAMIIGGVALLTL